MYDERTNLGQQVAREVSHFFRESLPDRDPPQRPPRRGAQSRQTGYSLRREVPRRRGVYRTSRREVLARRRISTLKHSQVSQWTNERTRQGLSALIPDSPAPVAPPPGVVELDIDRLSPNDYQPRRQMDDARLEELAASIKANGVIQPIIVRTTPEGIASSPANAGGARRAARG